MTGRLSHKLNTRTGDISQHKNKEDLKSLKQNKKWLLIFLSQKYHKPFVSPKKEVKARLEKTCKCKNQEL